VRKAVRKNKRREGISGEKEKAPQGSMCCPFIGAFAHAQGVFVYVLFVPYLLPALAALSCQFAHWSTCKRNVVLSCRLLWRFLQRPGRGDNCHVETKSVHSGLLQPTKLHATTVEKACTHGLSDMRSC